MSELPDSARREFAEELFGYYRSARRPRLADIEERIRPNDEMKGYASRETIRKMLTGKTVPANWDNVYVVFKTLCDMADLSVDDYRFPEEGNWADQSRATHIEYLWNSAIDEPATGRASGSSSGYVLDDPNGAPF